MSTTHDPVHPDLRRYTPFVPRGLVGPRTSPLLRRLSTLSKGRPQRGVTVTDLVSPTSLRTYRPTSGVTSGASLLWMHGGGMVIGRALQDDAFLCQVALELGILVVGVDYRLAPEHPYPAAIDDCYAGLRWLHSQSGVDRSRIAVGGASAGGGLAASLAQVALDRGELDIALQLLVYPMLDDRSGVRPDIDGQHHRLWSQRSNRFGWGAYLGQTPPTAPAVPARRESLAGLPPAWIGVGTHDLFHDEDVDYAQRLRADGVACELHVVPGAFHGFDAFKATPVARDFRARQLAALHAALADPNS